MRYLSPANPILRGMYPDPSICRVGSTYYVATSTFEYLPGIPIHASTDLVNWQLAGHAIHDPEQFDFSAVPDSRGIFAPTIRHHNGRFYIACTQMDGGIVSGNFYLTAEDVAGPWSAPVLLPEARGIDPSLFFHEGRAWWLGCREVLEQTFEGETEVWLQELDLQRGELIGQETVIWTRTQYRAVWAEAPHLYERNGWFYLVTAEGGTAFEHSVMVARSRSVTGPYLPNPRNPVLTHRHLGHDYDVQYVGHADLVEGDDGQWWMVMLATRPIEGHHVLGRETNLARVTWEDDWPVVNAGLGRLDSPTGREQFEASNGSLVISDFISLRGYPTFATVEQSGVRLRSTGAAIAALQPPAALLRRLTSTDSTVSVTLDEIGTGAIAGLVLRQSGDVHVRAEARASGGEIWIDLVVRNREDTIISSVTLPATALNLAAEVSPEGIAWTAATADSSPVQLGQTALSAVSTETAGGFVGTTWGAFVAGPEGASALFTAWSHDDRQ